MIGPLLLSRCYVTPFPVSARCGRKDEVVNFLSPTLRWRQSLISLPQAFQSRPHYRIDRQPSDLNAVSPDCCPLSASPQSDVAIVWKVVDYDDGCDEDARALESCKRGARKAVEMIDGSDITGMRHFHGSAGLSRPGHRLAGRNDFSVLQAAAVLSTVNRWSAGAFEVAIIRSCETVFSCWLECGRNCRLRTVVQR